MVETPGAPRVCPQCSGPLRPDPADPHRLECRPCGGVLVGLSPFERMLTDGVGTRMWVASHDGSPAGPCPWCGRPMASPAPGAGGPAGLAVCHLCQQVWIPAAAGPWMTAHAAPGPVPAPGAPAAPPGAVAAECSNCGAPAEPDQLGRCRYCHAQIAAPQPVTVELVPDPEPLGGGVLSGLARLLDQPL